MRLFAFAIAAFELAGCSPTGLARQSLNLVVPTPTYCRSASGDYYSLQSQNCAAGDTEIRSWDYQKGVAEKKETARKARAAEENQPKTVYCTSSRGNVPYIAASGSCTGEDTEISKSQYDDMKEQAHASLLSVPKLEEQAPEKPQKVEVAKPAANNSTTDEIEEPKKVEKIEVPPPTQPEASQPGPATDHFCLIIAGHREVFVTKATGCPNGSTEISSDAYSEGNIVSESDAMQIISSGTDAPSQP
jgi:hypothetical protein